MELAAVTKLECKLRSTSRSSSAFLFLVIPERLRRFEAHEPTDSKHRQLCFQLPTVDKL